MARTNRMLHYRRCLAGVLAALIGLGPLLTPAYAVTTALGDQPIGAQVKAKPNIMLTVDDSSSMLYDFLPDSVIGTRTGVNNYCRDITGRMNAQCGLFDIAIDLTAQGRGRTRVRLCLRAVPVSGVPEHDSTEVLRVTLPKPIDNSGLVPDATRWQSDTTCSGGIDPGALPGLMISEPGGSTACVSQGWQSLRVLVAVARAGPQQRTQSPLLQPEDYLRPPC
jgi:hypothetical protein